MEFAEWLDEVNEWTQRIAGVSRLDLADYPYRDAFDSHEDPYDVAADVLAENGFPEEEEDIEVDDDVPFWLEYERTEDEFPASGGEDY